MHRSTPTVTTAAVLLLAVGLLSPAAISAESDGDSSATVRHTHTTIRRDGEPVVNRHARQATVTQRDGDAEGSHTTVRRTHTTIRRDGEPTVHRHRQDQVTVERDENGVDWTRETTVRDNQGRERDVVAQGHAERTGDGSGTATVTRSGTATNRDGDERSWTENVDRDWERNDLGGRDTTTNRERTNDDGQTVSETANRRTRDDGPGSRAWIQESERTRADGTVIRRQGEGRTTRRRTSDGYIEDHVSRGRDSEGHEWREEERTQVRYQRNGQRQVTTLTATQRDNQPARFVLTQGVFQPVGNDRGWNYHGQVEVREGRRVVETRQVQRRVRRLPFPNDQDDIEVIED